MTQTLENMSEAQLKISLDENMDKLMNGKVSHKNIISLHKKIEEMKREYFYLTNRHYVYKEGSVL